MRNIDLDPLRFIAVLLVILCHLSDDPLLPQSALTFIRSGGGFGVTLFFVLSGFLVSGLLFGEYDRSGSVDVGRFLTRRGFKLYPPYWALLAVRTVLALPSIASDQTREFWLAFAKRFFFLQNYFSSLFDHTWTLAVEGHFYLLPAGVTAILVRLNSAKPFRFIPMLFIATAIGSAWLRGQALADSKTHPLDLVRTQYAIDALFFGVWLSYLRTYHDLDRTLGRMPSLLLAIAGVLVAGLLPQTVGGTPAFQGVFGHVSGYLGAGLIVLAAYKVRASTSKTLQFLGYLGSTSYSTYLWHGFVNILVRKGPEWLFGFCNPWVYVIGYVGGAFAVGVLMNRLIEQPAMRLRDRWQPGRGSGGIAPQAGN